MERGRIAMSSETAAEEFENYARDLVRLSRQPNTPPELRDQLLAMAREWMQAAMGEEPLRET